MNLSSELGNVLQLEGCVSILCSAGVMQQQLLALGTARPCRVLRLLEADSSEGQSDSDARFERRVEVAAALLRRAEGKAAAEGVELALQLDSALASALAQRFSYAVCGLLHAWCWAPLWAALETDLTFGSADALPWITLTTGRLLHLGGNAVCLADTAAPAGSAPLLLGADAGAPALVLTGLYLPANLRRCGHGTRILERLAQRAKREGRRFVVGPIVEEAMEALCAKLGYTACAPFSAVK